MKPHEFIHRPGKNCRGIKRDDSGTRGFELDALRHQTPSWISQFLLTPTAWHDRAKVVTGQALDTSCNAGRFNLKLKEHRHLETV